MNADPPVTTRRIGRENRKAGSGSAFLTMSSAESCSQVTRLVRGIIVARVLGPEMMGIAFSMLIVVDFLERIISLNPGITLVQDRKGGSRGFRHTLQLILLLRGVAFALAALALAWPLAWLSSLNQAEYLLGFFAIAAIPALRGLKHVDVFRQLRNRRYVPAAIVTTVPEFISMIAVVLLSLTLSTFWLPIVGRIIGSIAVIVTSFAVAKRKFGLAFDSGHIRRIFRFIVPLIGAGLLVFLSIQGSRLLLQFAPRLFDSITYTMDDVGYFGVALLLCMLPESVGARIISSTWNPQLARLRDDPVRFQRVFVEMQSVSYTMAAAGMVLLGAGSVWVSLLYDESYAVAGPLVAVLSVFGGLRLGRSAMRCAALATGRSVIILKANLAGLIGLVCTIIVVSLERPLIEIAFTLIIGELASFIVGNLQLAKGPLALRVRDLWLRPILFIALGISVAFLERAFLPDSWLVVSALLAVALTGFLVVVIATFNPNVRQFLQGARRSGSA